MAIDYSGFAIPKGTPRVVEKANKRKVDAQAERVCRVTVYARDQNHCRVPRCRGRSIEMHHIVPRSRSSTLKWATSNNMLLCKDHHDLRHAGVIQISGDANRELVITGDVDRLKHRR